MTHNIRQKVINNFGQKVTKIFKAEGELGSGILDKNGREIFEGDEVKDDDGRVWTVEFFDGSLMIIDGDDAEDLRYYSDGELEIVGHADD